MNGAPAKRDGARIIPPASPRQQWVLEMWDNGRYETYRLFATLEEAQRAAYEYTELLAEFRQQAHK